MPKFITFKTAKHGYVHVNAYMVEAVSADVETGNSFIHTVSNEVYEVMGSSDDIKTIIEKESIK